MSGRDKGKATAVAETRIPTSTRRKLERAGVVTVPMLLELLACHERSVARIIGEDMAALKNLLRQEFVGQLDGMVCHPHPFVPVVCPVGGIPVPTADWVARTQLPAATRETDDLILNRLERIRHQLPSSVLLHDWLPDVQDQGMYGTCVGFGTTASREFAARRELSPGFAYRGAKLLDGMYTIEGSFQQFAFEFMVQIGHVGSDDYSYEDAISARPIQRLFNRASLYRIRGYVDARLRHESFMFMPLLLKAILSGKFFDQLGPCPVSVSLRTPASFFLHAVAHDGVVPDHLPGMGKLMSGHAMTLVGYVDADDERGLFGRDYFVVRNSYGPKWAAANPLGLAGHALMPHSYFVSADDFWESLICIAEPSPVHQGWIRRLPGRWS